MEREFYDSLSLLRTSLYTIQHCENVCSEIEKAKLSNMVLHYNI